MSERVNETTREEWLKKVDKFKGKTKRWMQMDKERLNF